MSDDRTSAHAMIGGALAEHAGLLRAFVAARVGRDEVDDVLQTAALRAVEGAASLRDPERVLAWLYRVHRTTITDLWRQSARHQRTRERLDPPEVAAHTAVERCRCSVAQVQSLRPSYASMLTLVDLGEASLSEAADALGISINNATVRLHRARKALRERLRAHCGVDNPRDCQDCRCVLEGCCAA